MFTFLRLIKQVLIVSLLVLTAMHLVTCGTLPTQTTGNRTINLTDVNSTAQSAASTLFAQTMVATPTSTIVPTDMLLSPITTQTPLPFIALDGLRVAYIMGDNLYVQDSGKRTIQLAHGVENLKNRPPLISDDGQKIIFYRAEESN